MKNICGARIKARGRGNYGFTRCTRTPVPGSSYCTIHIKQHRRAAAKLAAYASQGKYRRNPMSGKDYIVLARAIEKMPDHAPSLRACKSSAASSIADALANDNPRFDRARFLKAALPERNPAQRISRKHRAFRSNYYILRQQYALQDGNEPGPEVTEKSHLTRSAAYKQAKAMRDAAFKRYPEGYVKTNGVTVFAIRVASGYTNEGYIAETWTVSLSPGIAAGSVRRNPARPTMDPRRHKRNLRRRGYRINPDRRNMASTIAGVRAKALNVRYSKHVAVQVQRGAMWHTFAMFPSTPEGKKNAKQYARIAHRKYPRHAIRVFGDK